MVKTGYLIIYHFLGYSYMRTARSDVKEYEDVAVACKTDLKVKRLHSLRRCRLCKHKPYGRQCQIFGIGGLVYMQRTGHFVLVMPI